MMLGSYDLKAKIMGSELTAVPSEKFIGRIGEDESGQASCVSAEGDGVKDGEDGLAKEKHIFVCWRDNDGGVDLLRCVEQGDDV